MFPNLKKKIKYWVYYRIQKPILLNYRLWQKPHFINLSGIKIPITQDILKAPNLLKALYAANYEKFELEIIKEQLVSDDIIMELGTCLGLISSYCAKKIGSERVFTYEANPKLEGFLKEMYKFNNVQPQFKICLLGEKEGKTTFYASKELWSSSLINRNDQMTPMEVNVYSFNEEVKKIQPTFLIMDIEGGEYDLLKYADLSNIKKIMIELHKYIIGKEKTQFILDKFKQAGFVVNNNSSVGDNLFLERKK